MKLIVTILVLFSFHAFSVEKTQKKCALPGDAAGGSAIGVLSCCEGFVQTNSWLHENYKKVGCQFPTPPGSSGSCVKCGDGNCDTQNFEDECSCMKDCKK